MQNGLEFVVVIIALSFAYKLVSAWMRDRAQTRTVTDQSANAATLQRLEQLEERVRVLERIVTDERFDLKQQFKDLASR